MEIVESNINNIFQYSQMMENLGSKAILFLVMCFLAYVSYHLLKQLLKSISAEKANLDTARNLETSIERIATSTEISLKYLTEAIKEQKEHNNFIRETLERSINNLEIRFNALEHKVNGGEYNGI